MTNKRALAVVIAILAVGAVVLLIRTPKESVALADGSARASSSQVAGVIAPHSPFEQYRNAVLLPPAWLEGGNWSYPLGTDPVGRDILSRLIYGSQYSLFIGVFVTTLSLTT